MYQLFYYPNNASLAPHFVLEEIGVEFELKLVDRKSDAQKSAEYLKLNPAGRIPTLVDDSFVMFESPAICLYLAEQNPNSSLVPVNDPQKRALFFQWMMYLTNTLQAELMIYFYPDKHITVEGQGDKIIAAQQSILKDIFLLLDNELSNKDYFLGDDISICDFFFLI